MTDDELLAAFSALMARMNNNHEQLLNRMAAVETSIHDLSMLQETTRHLVTSLPGTVLGAIEAPMLKRLGDHERRITKLEDGEEAA